MAVYSKPHVTSAAYSVLLMPQRDFSPSFSNVCLHVRLERILFEVTCLAPGEQSTVYSAQFTNGGQTVLGAWDPHLKITAVKARRNREYHDVKSVLPHCSHHHQCYHPPTSTATTTLSTPTATIFTPILTLSRVTNDAFVVWALVSFLLFVSSFIYLTNCILSFQKLLLTTGLDMRQPSPNEDHATPSSPSPGYEGFQ